MMYPDLDDYIAALGKEHVHKMVRGLLDLLGVKEEGLINPFGTETGHRNVVRKDLGVQLDFEDIGLSVDIPYHDIGDGPWLLKQVVFWSGKRNEWHPYSGGLPYGVRFDMTREDLLSLLSLPQSGHQINGVRVSDRWSFEHAVWGQIELLANYDLKTGAILGFALRTPIKK